MSGSSTSRIIEDEEEFDSSANKSDPGKNLWARCLMQVVWPAFIGAAITVGLLFSLIDPLQIELVHVFLHDSREAAYSIGFIVLWALYIFACAFTWFLATTETPAGKPGST